MIDARAVAPPRRGRDARANAEETVRDDRVIREV